ncbi:protein TCL1B2-like [Mesocricetus auratus]|uniref:Protein TCL1B2-like n=1 Tax=Mesocricetus auratus TaxID=10036 RepID=A0ABM2X9Z8_MESAU|nr:protein TCL1B2-like [Mesocricetus auratus]
MAAGPFLIPVTLTREIPGYYKDENQRLWIVATLLFKTDHLADDMHRVSVTVRLCQVGECCAEFLSQFSSSLACLPSVWQKDSDFSYTDKDSRFWIKTAHYRTEGTLHLTLRMQTPLGDESS